MVCCGDRIVRDETRYDAPVILNDHGVVVIALIYTKNTLF